MKNAMQLKAIMKKLAKENQISAQLVLQNYMLERFLERVSLSPYRDNYIIKGGFLISSMVGLNSRATMDMDATIKGYPVTQDAVQKMIEKILTVSVDDDITFTFKSIGEIREGDEYTGYRVALTADFPPMAVPLKLDITTGDKITPREIQYDYKLMLEDRHIQVMAYNLATILAEKLETVISRSDQNTRPRDYYDVYILTKLQAENIDFPALGAALMATASKRGSDSILQDYVFFICNGIVTDMADSMGGISEAMVSLPAEMQTAIENVGFLASIPLWLVTILGSLFITVLSFVMILTVYGRFFRLYMYTALAPLPLAAFAGESTQSVGISFLKSYVGVCLEGAVIVLACVIYSAFVSTPTVASGEATTIVWSYLAETVFNMLVLVGLIKGSDRIIHEMMGL